MIFFWTKSSKIGSRLIRWGLGEDCSHFAIGFFEDSNDPRVLESRLENGVRDVSFSEFISDGKKIIHAIQWPEIGVEENRVYTYIKNEIEGRPYDAPAVIFWALAGIKRKLFGGGFPIKNDWGRDELFYCVEIVSAMPRDLLEDFGLEFLKDDIEMMSPHQVFDELRFSDLRDITEAFQCRK